MLYKFGIALHKNANTPCLTCGNFSPVCSCWTEPAKPTPTQEEVEAKDAKISAEVVADEDDDEDFEIIEPDDGGVEDETLEKGFL